MLKILKNDDATAAEIETAIEEIREHVSGLEQQRNAIKSKLIDLKVDDLAGENVAKAITAERKKLDNVDLEIEAFTRALKILESRFAERTIFESQDRLNAIDGELEELLQKKDKLMALFLKTCADAVVIREQIEGVGINYLSGKIDAAPSLKISVNDLVHKRSVQYMAAVKLARDQAPFKSSVNSDTARLERERDQLEAILRESIAA